MRTAPEKTRGRYVMRLLDRNDDLFMVMLLMVALAAAAA